MFWLRVPPYPTVQTGTVAPGSTRLAAPPRRPTGVYRVQSPSGGGTTSWFDVHTAWNTGEEVGWVSKAHPVAVRTNIGPCTSM